MIKIRRRYNGQGLSQEWVKSIRRELRSALKGLEDYDGKIELNFYYFSGFVSRNGRYVYVSSVDTRFWRNWRDRILIRYARDDRDYAGGSNKYVPMSELSDKVKEMLNQGGGE